MSINKLRVLIIICFLIPSFSFAFTFPFPGAGGGNGGGAADNGTSASVVLLQCRAPQTSASSSCSSTGTNASSCSSNAALLPSVVDHVETSANTPADAEDDLKSRQGEACVDVLERIDNTYHGTCQFSVAGDKMYYTCSLP